MIIIFKFILPYKSFNLAFSTFENREKSVQKTKLITIKLVEIFIYRKNNNWY